MNKIGGLKKQKEGIKADSLPGFNDSFYSASWPMVTWVDKVLKDKASKLRSISAKSCLKKEVKKVSGMFL